MALADRRVNALVSRNGLTVLARLGDAGPLGQLDVTLEALAYGAKPALVLVVIVAAAHSRAPRSTPTSCCARCAASPFARRSPRRSRRAWFRCWRSTRSGSARRSAAARAPADASARDARDHRQRARPLARHRGDARGPRLRVAARRPTRVRRPLVAPRPRLRGLGASRSPRCRSPCRRRSRSTRRSASRSARDGLRARRAAGAGRARAVRRSGGGSSDERARAPAASPTATRGAGAGAARADARDRAGRVRRARRRRPRRASRRSSAIAQRARAALPRRAASTGAPRSAAWTCAATGRRALARDVGTLFQDPETQVVMGTRARASSRSRSRTAAQRRRRRARGRGGRARARHRGAARSRDRDAVGRRAPARRARRRTRRAPAPARARRADLAARPGRRRRAARAAAPPQRGVGNDGPARRAPPRALPRRRRPRARARRRRGRRATPRRAASSQWAHSAAPALETPGAGADRARSGSHPAPAGVKQARRDAARGTACCRTAAARQRQASRSRRAGPPPRARRSRRALRCAGVWHELRRAARRSSPGSRCAVAPGERVALLGRNGAGKSTLLRHAAGAAWSRRAGAIERAGRVALLLQHPGDYFIHDRVGDELDAGRARARRPRRRSPTATRATAPAASASVSRWRSSPRGEEAPRRALPRRADARDGPRRQGGCSRRELLALVGARASRCSSRRTTPSSRRRFAHARDPARRRPRDRRREPGRAALRRLVLRHRDRTHPRRPSRHPHGERGGRRAAARGRAALGSLPMSWQLASFVLLGLALAAGFAWYERSRPVVADRRARRDARRARDARAARLRAAAQRQADDRHRPASPATCSAARPASPSARSRRSPRTSSSARGPGRPGRCSPGDWSGCSAPLLARRRRPIPRAARWR